MVLLRIRSESQFSRISAVRAKFVPFTQASTRFIDPSQRLRIQSFFSSFDEYAVKLLDCCVRSAIFSRRSLNLAKLFREANLLYDAACILANLE